MALAQTGALRQILSCAVVYLAAAFTVGSVSPFSLEGAAMAAMSLSTGVAIAIAFVCGKLIDASELKAGERSSEGETLELARQIMSSIHEWKPELDEAYAARETAKPQLIEAANYTELPGVGGQKA